MVAPIGSAASSATAAASARPQVQSRRVSLRLGPLGISYASDELVWGQGDDQSENSGSGVGAVSSASAASGSSTSASQQVDQQTSTRSFDQELFNAWRAQVGERAGAQATYGRDGTLNTGAAASGGNQSAGSAQAESAATTQAASASTSPTASTTAAATATAQAAGASSSRMRSAISAYLACARDIAGPGSMLTAVA